MHTVDLSAHPPYHLPPEGFKVPNGSSANLGSDSGSDGDASMTSATAMDINIMDTNRNITWVANIFYVEANIFISIRTYLPKYIAV